MVSRRYLFIFFSLVFISNLSAAERGHWLDPVKDEPMGTHYKTFFSPTIQGQVSYLIYLPPEYEKAVSRCYPVVYWLHGGGGNQRTGDNFVERLDEAIRSGAAPEMIAVLVNGVGGSLFCDSFDGKKPVETVIVKDLIPHIDATYRTHGTQQMRAVEGFSMGGFGALHLAFKYPDLFGAVTALAHAPIRPDSGWPKVDRVWKTGPLAGNVDYFRKNDPFQLVEDNSDTIRRGMQVRLIVGDSDNPNTVARTRELYEKMKGLNLSSELIIVPGVKHSYKNLYQELGDREFVFYKKVFAEALAGRGKGQVQAAQPRKAKADEKALRRNRKRVLFSDDSTSAPAVGKPALEDGKLREPKKNRLAGLKLSWVEPDKTEPPGTTYKTFHSKTVNCEVSYLIYLPPDYDKEPNNRYPVLYWLHGSGSQQNKGGGIVKMVDQAIRDSKAPAMIIVLINGLRGATMYCDTKGGKWPLESVIVNDLVPHIDVTYRTTNRREARAVEGFSMGGFGAAHLGFKYPDLFGVVSILAPALLGPDIKADMPKRKWIEHFSFVFKEDIDYFHANDPFQLIGKNAERLRGRSVIRLVPHDEESKWLIPRCEALHALLEKHKITHKFDIRTDIKSHNYRLMYDKMGEQAVGFYAKAFAASSSEAALNPAFAPVKDELAVVRKPLTDMTAEDRYRSEDGGLYSVGKNSPPEAHLKAALAEVAKIRPLDEQGRPSPNGKIVLMTHGMSNTNLESQRFIEVANADPLKSPAVVLINGSQGGIDSRKWVNDTHTRSGVSPWDRLGHRIKSAGVTPQQVQVIWMKHAISMKNNASRKRRFGEFPEHAQQLKDDMAQIVGMLKNRYPNLKLAYVSSRSYGGYAGTTLNPEPYAFESAFAVRWLIQDQIKGVESLSYTAGKAPLLLWGPYLWADGGKGRKYDSLVYRREDFVDDGTHPSDSGQQKIAEQLLKFFKTDPTATTWFLKH